MGKKQNKHTKRRLFNGAFTLVELLLVIAVIAILALITVVTYQGIQRRSAQGVVTQTVSDALKNLQVYYAFNRSYPSNLADTEYKPPLSTAVALYTNTPQQPVYQNLTPDQNAQLFLNACNGFMPITDGTTQYNTSCIYNGNNLHVKGTISSNLVITSPVTQSNFNLNCGAACDAAEQQILASFTNQGGVFPITVPKSGSTLPKPTSVTESGPTTRFCIEAKSAAYNDIAYHSTSETQTMDVGPCPSDPALHYP